MNGKSFAASVGCLAVLTVVTACTQSPIRPSAASTATLRAAPGAGAFSDTTDTVRVRAPISFTLGGCPSLPSGVTVSGTGEDVLVMNIRVAEDGVTYIERNDLATGTATDSTGAAYKFNYHNHAGITVPVGGFPWSFTSADHFNLVGNGQSDQLQVHFVARVTFPSPTDPPIAEFVNTHGNPFFCDPI